MHKVKLREQEQIQREKRLKAAEKLPMADQILKKKVLTDSGKKHVMARLSIIVAPNKRGDIVVRDG